MPFCSNCGKKFEEGTKFCPECGTPVAGTKAGSKEQRKTVYEGEIHKCPNCGETVDSFVGRCPSCGFELNQKQVASSLKEFIVKIEECNAEILSTPSAKTGWGAWSGAKKFWWVVLNICTFCIPLAIYLAIPLIKTFFTPKLTAPEKKMTSLIENFPFPNDRESILSALMFVKEKVDFISKKDINQKSAYWVKLWCSKAEQLKQRADILIPDDSVIKQSYDEILKDKTSVNKTIKVKAIAGLVILVLAIIGAIVFYSARTGTKSYDSRDYSSTFEWRTTGLFAKLPEPDTNKGEIVRESDSQIKVEVYEISSSEFNKYTDECREKGFTEDITKTSGVFYAYDDEGYSLDIFYYDDKDVMSIYLSVPQSDETTSDSSSKAETSADDTESKETSKAESSSKTESSKSESSESEKVTASFKETMDSYEEFMDEYIAFMESYKNSDDTTAMLAEYTEFMQKYSDYMTKISEIDQSSLSAADLAYYLEVTTRVTEKLSSVSY